MIKLHCTARGEFKVDVRRGGELVPLAPWQSNLITDSGMDSLAADYYDGYWNALAVGTGNTPPQFSDTRLADFAASTSVAYSWVGSREDNVVTLTAVGTFALGAVVGNVSEVGILLPNNGTATRALIRDGGGQPTTIMVQATDQLIVTYRVIFTVDQSISSQTITDPNTSVQYAIRAKYGPLDTNPDSYGIGSSVFGTWTGGFPLSLVGGTFNGPGEAPSGGENAAVHPSAVTYANTSYVQGTFSMVGGIRFGTNATELDRDGVNILGVPAYVPSGMLYLEFDPPFRKPATSTATLQWRVSWARG